MQTEVSSHVQHVQVGQSFDNLFGDTPDVIQAKAALKIYPLQRSNTSEGIDIAGYQRLALLGHMQGHQVKSRHLVLLTGSPADFKLL